MSRGSSSSTPGVGGPPAWGTVRASQRGRAILRDPARVWQYFGIPVVVVVAVTLTVTFVSGQELISREERALNPDLLLALGLQHVRLGLTVVFWVLVLSIPLGVMLTRPWAKPYAPAFIAVANAGQAIPSFGLMVLFAIWIGTGETAAVAATVAYCILPVLRNTMVGLNQVDPSIIEAARGMGMTKRGVLLQIELPLSVPVMLAGVRTALILAIGTITLGALIGAGTFGRTINAGIIGFSDPVLVTGAVAAASLALLVDWAAGIVEDFVRPKGL